MLKFSDEVVKTASYLFIESFWWENYFHEETLMFFNQVETFSEKILPVCREIFGRFAAIAINVFIGFFLRNKFCLKISIFYHLGKRSKKYRTPSSNFRRGCQKCIQRVHKIILTKTAFFLGKTKTFVVIGPSAELFLNSIEIYRRGFDNCILHVHLNILSKEVFLWKLLSCFCLFRTLSKRILTICREFFRRGV